MIALEGRLNIIGKDLINIELFVPCTTVFYGKMFPIYALFPNSSNNVTMNYNAGKVSISYQKVTERPKKLMRPYFNKNKIFSEGNFNASNDYMISSTPCTLIIGYDYSLFDLKEFGCNIKMIVMIDITDTLIRFHWRKNYTTDPNNNVSLGSTEDSTVELSYNNDNTIQFIISDDSLVNSIKGVNIAVREIEPDRLTKAESIITPDILKGNLYGILDKSNNEWIYNIGKYAKVTTKTISETEILDDDKKEDNDEQSGDNVQ